MLAEYAYYLKEGGWLYTATDVLDLHEWMVSHLDAHPLFARVPENETAQDPVVAHVLNSTEEGMKVARNAGSKYIAIYKRILHPVEQANPCSIWVYMYAYSWLPVKDDIYYAHCIASVFNK